MKWVFLFIISSIVVFSTTLYFRLGGYKDVQIERSEQPGFHIIFKPHTGPYHKINSVIKNVEKWAQDNKVSCTKTFGEYIDDPKITEEARLRSRGGCITNSKVDHLSDDIEYLFVEKMKVLKATFNGSPAIGPLKVYPKVEDWMLANRLSLSGSVFEIYIVINEKEVQTEYLFPIQ